MSEKKVVSSKEKNKKVAVVLFNLGGPDSLDAVKPFLFNLFFDKYIIRLPAPFRYLIAKLISSRRNKIAQEIYSNTGNKSPILKETQAQKLALEKKLSEQYKGTSTEFQVFIAMRHWHPFAEEAIAEIDKYGADEVVLLPLYPQFSTTTSLSSIEDFKDKWRKRKNIGKEAELLPVCCYPFNKKFINSHVALLKEKISNIKDKSKYRILFSAHGLPKKIVEQGDSYQWQVEKTVELIMAELKEEIDYKVTYQSRVGPLEWLKPDTEEEIKEAGKAGASLIVVPVAFVSEHVETLVELDIEYAEIAEEYKIDYLRVPTLSIDDSFIDGLAEIVEDALARPEDKRAGKNFPYGNKRICPDNFSDCPCSQK